MPKETAGAASAGTDKRCATRPWAIQSQLPQKSKPMRSEANIRGLAYVLAALTAALATSAAMAVEEPTFQSLVKDGAFELRRYPSLVVAETVVKGDMDAASNQGFRRIADFIFGNNAATTADKKTTIAMTAPVVVEPLSGADFKTAPEWRVQFVMPGQYSLGTLPQPNNPAVELRQAPARTTAVVTYSGLNTEGKVQAKTEELRAWIVARQWEPLGPPLLARYDPPWTLPPWRRNEIQIEVRQP